MSGANTPNSMQEEVSPPTSAGFLKFYGLYWDKEYIYENERLMPGIPHGWTGRGVRGLNRDTLWMNFWNQKGVYVLYDSDLSPVYTGQAGLRKSNSKKDGGRTLGDRIAEHRNGKYRNGWKYFSWFGFLDCENEKKLKGKLKSANKEDRKEPGWNFKPFPSGDVAELTMLLDSFEAVLIEAFAPRFNSRGGNLKGAYYVDQFESTPAYIQELTNR